MEAKGKMGEGGAVAGVTGAGGATAAAGMAAVEEARKGREAGLRARMAPMRGGVPVEGEGAGKAERVEGEGEARDVSLVGEVEGSVAVGGGQVEGRGRCTPWRSSTLRWTVTSIGK